MAWDHSLAGLLSLNIVMVVLGTTCTAMRFWSRAVILKGQYGLDDWLCLAAMFPMVALAGVGMYMVRNGLVEKLHVSQTRTQEVHNFSGFFICSILFSLGLGLTKLSTLAFYRRVFGHLRQSNLFSWTIPFFFALFVTVGWLILAISYILFRCRPVRKAWAVPPEPDKCISTISTYLLVLGVVNLFEDIVLILLPIPQILKLALKPRKKAMVTAMVVFGSSIPLICIGRIVAITCLRKKIDQEFPYWITPIGFWLIAEPSVSLLAISLPALFQLFKRARKHGVRSLLTTRDHDLHARRTFYQRGIEQRYSDRWSPPVPKASHEMGRMSSEVRAGADISIKDVPSTDSGEILLDNAANIATPEVIHIKREFNVSYHG